MKKALFYSPHAFTWPHAFPEALIAEALQSEDIHVHQIGCARDFKSHCIPMDSESLREGSLESLKEEICNLCIKKKQLLRGHFKLEYSDIADYVPQEDLQKIQSWLKEIKPENILDFKIDDLPIGRASLYDFTLLHKKFQINKYSEEEWTEFQKRLKSVLISFCAGKRILEKHKPDYLFFYSSQYACNLVVLKQAQRLKIPCFSIYGGDNWINIVQRMHITSDEPFRGAEERIQLWREKYSKKTVTLESLLSLEGFQRSLFLGKSVFLYGGKSHHHDWRFMRKKWGIQDHQKVLLLATSSYDEFLAARAIDAVPEMSNLIFETQLEWIQKTINFVSNRADLFLIIRVHPRELPNRRDNRTSEHAILLEKTLKGNLPDNVKVNWPDDKLSIYDWFENVDLGLIFWSNVGKEMALWGIPCLTYAPNFFYPAADFMWVADSLNDYFAKIDFAFKEGWKESWIRPAHRWFAFELEGAVFDISDVVPDRFTRPRPVWVRAIRKYIDSLFEERLWTFFHRKPLKQSSLIKKRVTSGASTEDVLEPTRIRLSEAEEITGIKRVVNESAKALWGRDWKTSPDPSPLRNNLRNWLKE